MIFYMQSFKNSREVNPQEWDAKINMWSAVIFHATQYKKLVVASSSTLKQLMTRERRDIKYSSQTNLPLGWNIVVSELEKRSELIDIKEFKNMFSTKGTQTLGSWLLQNVLFKPATYLFWGRSSQESQQDKTYVVMRNVKSLLEQLVEKVYSNKVSHLDLFLAPYQVDRHFDSIKSNVVFMTKEEVDIILDYLHTEGPGKIINLDHGKKGIRFNENRQVINEESDPVVDRGVIQLKQTLHTLELQKIELDGRITMMDQEIKSNLTKKQKQIAKQLLIKKKSFQESLSRRLTNYDNIENMLTTIETAHSDSDVLKAIHAGTHSLKSATNQLEQTNPDKILDEAAQVMTDYKDIQNIIDAGNNTLEVNIDENELLAELDSLMISSPQSTPSAPADPISPKSSSSPPVTATTAPSTPPKHHNQSTSVVVPNISEKCILYQLSITTGQEDEKREKLNLSLKLLKLKLNQYQKNGKLNQHVEHLKSCISEYEKKALDCQQEEKEEEALLAMKYVELMEQEVSELEAKQAVVENNKPLVA
ncbi:charged multivesicular body protein 7 [Acrasis kona]|uniref:Charged multivesicular body protein 7 n=1 Tax=Acrasis kona TaxID=1008807 RepID=A0AAW2YSD7_9EUKA